ncbi:HU family DNA-binding protein [Candidatus Rhodobacter oscarellae]|uniref:HU family DNA-binding protein n=1 Tax=Candidatus Rhodobacter oscarellae TaxID=1675527 RepID=UPI001F394A2E|nr:HU family DNA-binding protein [Candidatus Rhodobacter lobularis]
MAPEADPVPQEPQAKPEILDAPELVTALGKRELIDRVVESSGIKKKAAKPVVEAMLRELGDALSRGDTLNLQPFGKGIVKTRKVLENAEVIELRLRRSHLAMAAAAAAEAGDTADGADDASDPLAEAAE